MTDAQKRDEWLKDAVSAFALYGGIETPDNRLPVALYLLDCFARGLSTVRAGCKAAERYLDGDFYKRA